MLKTTVYLWKYSCPTGTHLVSGSDTLMSLKYAFNPCLLQARRSRSQGRIVGYMQPLAVPHETHFVFSFWFILLLMGCS